MGELLMWIGRLPLRSRGRAGLGAVIGSGVALADATGGRSLAVFSVVGAISTLFGFGLFTDWGGIRTEHARLEGERVVAALMCQR